MVAAANRPRLGEVVFNLRVIVNRCEGFGAEATRRFEKSGGFKADGALGIVPWLKDKVVIGRRHGVKLITRKVHEEWWTLERGERDPDEGRTRPNCGKHRLGDRPERKL